MIPYFTRRNAAYRGTRESEKHLMLQKERLKDFKILFDTYDEFDKINKLCESNFINNGNIGMRYLIKNKDNEYIYDIQKFDNMSEAVYILENKIDYIRYIINENIDKIATQYLIWDKLDRLNWTWDYIEQAGLTWDELEVYDEDAGIN